MNNIPIAISFDIDGTLGKQKSQINEVNFNNMANEYTVMLPNDEFGNFIFFKGIIELLQKVNALALKYGNIHIMLSTAGFKNSESPVDRNKEIIKYINDILGRKEDDLIPLYDVLYQTFHPNDIELALNNKFDDGTICGKQWQEWFNDLFKVHSIDDLYIANKESPDFEHYFYRDHQVILNKHPELYKNLTLNRILHIDDSPKSVMTLNTDNIHVRTLSVDKNHSDKLKECQSIFSNIEIFIKHN